MTDSKDKIMKVEKHRFDFGQIEKGKRNKVRGKVDEIKALTQQTLENIIQIGRNLRELKADLEDRTFQKLVREELDIAPDTAVNWSNLSRLWDERPDWRDGMRRMALNALYILSRSTIDESVQEHIISLAEQGEVKSRQEVRDIVQEYRSQKLEEYNIDEEARNYIGDHKITENDQELKSFSRLPKQKQREVGKLLSEGVPSKRQAMKMLTQNEPMEVVSAEPGQETVEAGKTMEIDPSPQFSDRTLSSLEGLPGESVDVALVESPLSFNWLEEGGLRRISHEIEPVLAPGGFMICTVGHKAIAYIGDQFEPLKYLHTLVVRRQPGRSRTIVGIMVTSASILNALVYKPPYRVPGRNIVDLQTAGEEIENGIELCYHRFLQSLLPAEGTLLHASYTEKKFNIEASLKQTAQSIGASQYIFYNAYAKATVAG